MGHRSAPLEGRCQAILHNESVPHTLQSQVYNRKSLPHTLQSKIVTSYFTVQSLQQTLRSPCGVAHTRREERRVARLQDSDVTHAFSLASIGSMGCPPWLRALFAMSFAFLRLADDWEHCLPWGAFWESLGSRKEAKIMIPIPSDSAKLDYYRLTIVTTIVFWKGAES